MKFYPAEGYIAVLVKTETKSVAGIIIPDNALMDRISKGVVVSTSQRRIETTGEYLNPKFDINTTVLYLKGNGTPIKLDGVDLIVLSEDEVLGSIVD